MPKTRISTVDVFDYSEADRFGTLLPSSNPGVLQLAFEKDGSRVVIECPAAWRHEIAMRLLQLDGAVVNVQMSWPPTKTRDVECPKCAAEPGDSCWSQGKDRRLKCYHAERGQAARRA